MLPDDKLKIELRELGSAETVSGTRLREARRLFARAIETPGGLKIQTIHSFCSALLRRFPLEARVTPQFTEMDERAAALLHSEIIEEIADSSQADLLYAVARHYSGESFDGLTAEIVRHRTHFTAELDEKAMGQLLGHPFVSGLDQVAKSVFLGGEQALLDRLVPALLASGVNDQKAGQKLATVTVLDIAALPAFESIFLTGSGAKIPFSAKIGSFPTKKCQAALADIMPEVEAWMQRVEVARERRLAVETVERTRALHAFAEVFLPAYERAKQLRGWLDFDDLILRARDLVTDPRVAAWVLFRLDGGIDHILVDEAQDTSPVQWQVIERLAQEFTSGKGARADTLRTIFVVGDKKQSIYSFQGADAKEFDKQAGLYKTLIRNAGETYREVPLEHSFRSSELVLRAVDLVFKRDDASRGVTSAIQPEVRHLPIRRGEQGLVEIWDLERGQSDDEVQHWAPKSGEITDPPHLVMARRIAATVAAWTQGRSPEMLKQDRPVKPSDILILVRQRSYLMAAIVRALKEAGVPVAGADRLKLLDHIAIQDLMALAQVCILPQDDLNLAGVLKSPLFTHDDGVTRFDDDNDLFKLAHQREAGNIRDRLEKAAEAGRPYTNACEQLARWRDLAARSSVFDFYSSVLSRDGGRRALLGGLGPEAADPIDAFLQLALEYEQQHAPSLAGFLAWLEATQADIRRDMDQAGGEVRVMTVHGAKGLEAPIVFLPDTCSAPETRKIDNVLFTDSNIPVWRLKSDYATKVTEALKDRAFEGLMEEYNRLLYVAMTRARYRLYVCGFVKPKSKTAPAEAPGASWYAMMHAALTGGETPLLHQHVGSEGFCTWRAGKPEVGDDKESSSGSAAQASAPPAWAHVAARSVAAPNRWLAPSRLDAAGETEDGWSSETALSPLAPLSHTRFRRGQLVHRLLQSLPELADAQREPAARRFLTANGVTEPELDATVSEIMALFADARFAGVFSAAARPEVSIAAMIDLPDQDRLGLTGQIDRLLVEPDRVLVVDFKTNRPPPDSVNDVPGIYLRQLAAYTKAIARVYPGRAIECALLWTDAPALMPIPNAMLEEAWQRSAITTV